MIRPEGQRPEQSGGLNHPETRDEVKERTHLVLEAYGERSLSVLRDMVRRGLGREVLGSVHDRPEDEHLGIDTYGENILMNIVRDLNLPAIIKGEHNNYQSRNMERLKPGSPYAILPIDAFDNSSQYKRDLDTPPYTAVSAFFPDGEPIGGVIGDIKDNKLYFVNFVGYPMVKDLETGQERQIFKSKVTDIEDPNFTLAVYLGSNEYSLPFFRHFEHLLERMNPKAILYAGGGAYVPAIVGRGAATAYMMFREPRTETDSGAAFALAADLDVVTVNLQTLKITPYRFDESRHDERDDFFIMANNRRITEQLIEEYRIGRELLYEKEWLIKFARRVLEIRPDLAGALAEELGEFPKFLDKGEAGGEGFFAKGG